ncbi:MAG: type III pantothenate kinase, partial [Coprococcus sp.]
ITDVVKGGIELLTGITPMVVGQGIKTGIRIAIDRPAGLGTDLVVDAVAASEEYNGPLAIFDLGTATTCSVVDEQRSYLGTLIMPGVVISQEALTEKTSQLPHIRFEKPKHMIGKNTVESMQSGLLYGNAAMLDGLIDRVETELGRKVTVIVTGGIGSLIVPFCRHEMIYDPDLLLKGLWYIYYKNQ